MLTDLIEQVSLISYTKTSIGIIKGMKKVKKLRSRFRNG